jgi:putative transposase
MPSIGNGEPIALELGRAVGWFYLAAIVDIYFRYVVGWAMSKQRDEQVVTKALEMALTQRKPGASLVHHCDRGSQYTSQGYLAVLKAADIQVRRRRKGDGYDNALMESFFGTRHARKVWSVTPLTHEQKPAVRCLKRSKCFTSANAGMHH